MHLTAGADATSGDYYVSDAANIVFNTAGLNKLKNAASADPAVGVTTTITTNAKSSAAGQVLTNTATVKVNDEETGLTSEAAAVRYGVLT